jgi:hypothetical protein
MRSDLTGFGEPGIPGFWLKASKTTCAELYVAFAAKNEAAVNKAYEAALANGGKDNGAPGLRPHKKRAGRVAPAELFREHFDRSRTAAGVEPWPSNALRHSFASYHLAHFRDQNALALEMGHTNANMLYQHYRELVRPKEAARFWRLRPAMVTNVVSIEAR